MIAQVNPTKLCGEISAIGSKSVAHRAMVLAALLSKTPVKFRGVTPSDDVEATANCLRALGARVEFGPVTTVFPVIQLPQKALLDCGESGSTFRFLLPVAAALGVPCQFAGSKRLLERPNDALIKTLQAHGVVFQNNSVCGKLSCGSYEIDGSISSQYVSGMLLALSLLHGTSTLQVVGKSVSRQYIDITVGVMKDFGVKVYQTDNVFTVEGGGVVPLEYTVEGDWSNAAFPLVCGALGSDIALYGLNLNSFQGDKAILSILEQAGANVTVQDDRVKICGGKLHAFCVDAEQIPDMVPILCVLAAFSTGETQISGVERLRLKESDRLSGVLQMLSVAGVSAWYSDGMLHISGGKPVLGGKFTAGKDHRMAMSQTVLALNAQGASQIVGAECVAKSYPQFFEDIVLLGGKCVLLEG